MSKSDLHRISAALLFILMIPGILCEDGQLLAQENTNLDGFNNFTFSVWVTPGVDFDAATARQDMLYKGPAVSTIRLNRKQFLKLFSPSCRCRGKSVMR